MLSCFDPAGRIFNNELVGCLMGGLGARLGLEYDEKKLAKDVNIYSNVPQARGCHRPTSDVNTTRVGHEKIMRISWLGSFIFEPV